MAKVEIREARLTDVGALAEVHVKCRQATYAGMLPKDHIDRRTVERRTATWHDVLSENSQDVFVACDADGTIVGFASGGRSSESVEGFEGELTTLYILPHAQHAGLGRRFVRAIGMALRRRGFHSAWVRVLSDNVQARRFYEKCGADVIGETTEEIDGFIYREHCYGWPDISRMQL